MDFGHLSTPPPPPPSMKNCTCTVVDLFVKLIAYFRIPLKKIKKLLCVLAIFVLLCCVCGGRNGLNINKIKYYKPKNLMVTLQPTTPTA